MVELVLRVAGELTPKHPHLTSTLGQGHSLHSTAQHRRVPQNLTEQSSWRHHHHYHHPSTHTSCCDHTAQHKGPTKSHRTEWLETPPPPAPSPQTPTSSCDHTAHTTHRSDKTSQNRVAGELSPQIPTSSCDYTAQYMGPTKHTVAGESPHPPHPDVTTQHCTWVPQNLTAQCGL